MTYRLPAARTTAGRVLFRHQDVDFWPARRETDYGLFFRQEGLGGHLTLEQFVELRRDAPHTTDQDILNAGLRMRLSF